jgi:oligosaccharide repeat unit polymerase
MSSAAPAYPIPAYGSLRLPAAAWEVLAYLAAVAVATLSFLAGWLPVNGAVVLTVVLLTTLIVQSFIHLGQGRHPVFLFLCTLMLFQGGRLIAYCFGAESDPMRVVIMTSAPFTISRDDAGLVLLALSLSAICIYAPCRWLYRPVAPPCDVDVRKYLPYLYLLFFATLPVQLFKNYRYYEYAQQHGGYTFIFLNHGALASSVPFWVRVIPLITFPVFLAIFVFERRKGLLFLVTLLYFSTASLILLLGSRGVAFSLILVLWWVARIKTARKTRLAALAVFAMVLLFVGFVIQKSRESEETAYHEFSALDMVSTQGISLNVTEVAFRYHALFSPYFGSYMLRELQNAFVASDASNYYRGRALGFDISVLINPRFFAEGYGSGSSYLAEAYVGGGMVAVVLVSLALGLGLHAFYRFSGNALLLFLFAMSLSEILFMPRGALLDWVSVLAKNGISILLLLAGWMIFRLVTSIRQNPVGV